MIKWSAAFYREEAIVDKIYVALTLADGTKLSLTEVDVWDNGFVRDTSTSVSDTFTVGGAVTAKATLILDNTDQKFTDYNFRKATAVVKLSAEVNGTEEVHPAGSYIVDDYEISGSTIILTMLDYMSKFDKKYDASKITWPASLDTIVRNACTECGVIFGMSSFPNQSFVVRKAPNDAALTYHEVISYAAQIACCYAKCSTDGQLLFGWYSTTYTKMKDGLDGYSYDAGEPLPPDDTGHGIVYLYSVDKIQTDDVLITGVTVTASEEVTDDAGNTSTKIGTYTEGSSGYVIQIDKNPLIGADDCQAVAGYLKPLIGMKFRPLTVTAVGNPAVEAGDCALVGYEDKSYACFLSNVSYTMGGSMTASCDAQPDKEATPYRYTETQKTEAKISELIQKERSARELAIQNFTEKLSSHAGLYSTVEKGESGGNVYYLHDHPQLSDSTIVWKMTAEAWGVSTDGGKTWNGGMMVNGDVITRILTATGINADWINTGQLSVKKDGKEVLFVDVDTGTVRIVADTFSMSSGETIAKSLEDAKKYTDDAKDAWSKELENQADKMIQTFFQKEKPEDPQFGDLWFNTKDNNSVSRWNGTDWESVRDKQIAKAVKAARDAQATADGKIKTFAQTAEPTDGMSVGDLWIDTDDNNKLYRYSGSSWVAYRDGQIAKNLQTAKDYADDAAEKAAKAAVDAQTQTDIFNKLTNSGKLKGLYMKDGQLYISATYILSGILKLGGANNGNGTLEIYNSSGTKIGTFDNTGINLGSGKFVADTSGNVTAKNITAYGSFICYENN